MSMTHSQASRTVPPVLDPEEFPTVECYRLNVLAQVVHNGLDVARLEVYRLAVAAGFFTDEVA